METPRSFEKSMAILDIYNTLNDNKIISDLRIKYADVKTIVFGVKRSKYTVKIQTRPTPEIAYLAGAIAGDGCFYFCKSRGSVYPRVRLAITGGDKQYLSLLNAMFRQTFGVGGQIHQDTRKLSCYNLFVNHRVVWLYFRNILKLDKKKLIVPKDIANQELFRFFLAGFFDTDGYVSRGVFGTMIGNKNNEFLRQLVDLSGKLYSLKFSPVKTNVLLRDGKQFERAYTRLKKCDSERFLDLIPLKNEKYGPDRIRTCDIRCVRATC